MSKESYIGGDYIEITGGSTKNFAGGNIENSSAMHFAQLGEEEGVLYAKNEESPVITINQIEDYYRFNPLSYAGRNNSKAVNNIYRKRESWGAKSPIIENGRSFEPYLMVNKMTKQLEKDQDAIPDLSNILFGIAIHHAGNSGLDNMREIQNEHIDDKARADIGYHFGIDLSGKIYEGRFIGVKGSHLDSYNTGIIGIVFIADLDHAWYDFDDSMTNAALASSILLINALKEQFSGITTLGGHREWKNNLQRSCPGDYGLGYVKALRNKVKLKSPKETGHA